MAKTKGAVMYTTKELMEKLSLMGCDVAGSLAAVAMNDWKALGYKSEFVESVTSKGDPVFKHVISPDMRLQALKILSEYLYPKRKAVEHSGEITSVIDDKLSPREIESILTDDPFLVTTGKVIGQLPS